MREGKSSSRFSGKEENEVYSGSLERWDTQLKGLVELERRCQDLTQEVQLQTERQGSTGWHGEQEGQEERSTHKIIKRMFSRNSGSWRSKGQEKLWNSCKRSICSQKLEGERARTRMLQRLGGSWATKHWNDARHIICPLSRARFPRHVIWKEVCSESSRKMRDKEETTSEASWIAVTKGKEKEVWRLEPEVGAERPEATVPWKGAEGVSVNPEGESRHWQARAKITREGNRTSNRNGRKGRWRGT